jgi:hypothetical protein
MINYKPEVIAFWEKYKDIDTEKEWEMMLEALEAFPPEANRLFVKCVNAIEKRYLEHVKEKVV